MIEAQIKMLNPEEAAALLKKITEQISTSPQPHCVPPPVDGPIFVVCVPTGVKCNCGNPRCDANETPIGCFADEKLARSAFTGFVLGLSHQDKMPQALRKLQPYAQLRKYTSCEVLDEFHPLPPFNPDIQTTTE